MASRYCSVPKVIVNTLTDLQEEKKKTFGQFLRQTLQVPITNITARKKPEAKDVAATTPKPGKSEPFVLVSTPPSASSVPSNYTTLVSADEKWYNQINSCLACSVNIWFVVRSETLLQPAPAPRAQPAPSSLDLVSAASLTAMPIADTTPKDSESNDESEHGSPKPQQSQPSSPSAMISNPLAGSGLGIGASGQSQPQGLVYDEVLAQSLALPPRELASTVRDPKLVSLLEK